MSTSSDSGLATRSVYHGCSTGCTEEWTLVTNKGKKNTDVGKTEVPQDGTSYLKALLKIGKEDDKVAPSEDQGFPPKNINIDL